MTRWKVSGSRGHLCSQALYVGWHSSDKQDVHVISALRPSLPIRTNCEEADPQTVLDFAGVLLVFGLHRHYSQIATVREFRSVSVQHLKATYFSLLDS